MKTLLLSLAVLMTAGNVPVDSVGTVGEDVSFVENPTCQDEEKESCPIDIDAPFADDRVLVTLKANASKPEGLSEDRIEQIFEEVDRASLEDISKVKLNPRLETYYKSHPFHQIYCLNLATSSKQNVLDVCEILRKKKDVLSACPDYYCENASSSSDKTNWYDQQWGLHGLYGVNAPAAWDITRGDSKTVTVGIIDSGIHNHPDLNDNIAPGWDFWNENGVTNDGDSDHGTHVAGIVAACTKGGGVFGVAPNVKVAPLQVESPFANNGNHANFWSTQIKAVSYATRLWGTSSQISVLNRSIGFDLLGIQSSAFDYFTSFTSAIANFPGLFVISAGNSEMNIDEGPFVSTYSLPNLIVVGALDHSGHKASFSNYGNAVNIFAPGVQIASTVKNGGHASYDGTSMATPFVSGAAALIYSINPGLEADQVKEAILSGARSITIVGNNGSSYSSKLLDACGALQYAQSAFTQEKMPLRLGVKGKNGSTWKIEITNPNSSTVYAAYNSKTCNENDAKTFNGLYDVKVVTIGSRSSKTVDITTNGTASFVTTAYGYERANRRCLMVSCAGGPSTSLLYPFSTEVFTNEIDYETRLANKNYAQYSKSNFKKFSSEPYELQLRVLSKPSWWGNGRIEIRNSWWYEVGIRYRTKLCNENDARSFIESDVISCPIRSGEALTKDVSANFLADSYAACVNYYYHGFYYSKVSYIPSIANNSSYQVNTIMIF